MTFFAILLVAGKWVVAAGGVVVLYQLGTWWRGREEARAQTWAEWVGERGWTFHKSWPEMISTFTGGPFGQGREKTAEKGFVGRLDTLRVFGFTYEHTTGLPHNEGRAVHLVCGVRLPGAEFPYVRFSREEREKLITRGRDQQFENREFNDLWHVQSSSDRFAHALVHPRMMEYLMGDLPRFEELWLEGDAILVSLRWMDVAKGMSPSPDVAEDLLRMLARFTGLLPSHLLRQVGVLNVGFSGNLE